MQNQYIQQVQIQNVLADTPPTWEKLCAASPELTTIQDDANLILKDMPRDRYFWQHYESLKRRLKSCVGWYAHPGLPEHCLTTQAYDLAYKTIFEGLI